MESHAPTRPSAAPAAAGNAWAELTPHLERFLRRRTDAHTAKDIAQEAVLRALERGPAQREDLRRWLYRVARHALVDAHRRGRRTSSEPPSGAAVAIGQLADGSDSVEENVNAFIGRWLLTELELLPTDYAYALRRVDVEGLSQRELARELGLSASGTRSRVQRGREMLLERARLSCHITTDRRGNVLTCQPKANCCDGSR
jgi:RNA polymerase sigma-70 factor (ECF subfamily)